MEVFLPSGPEIPPEEQTFQWFSRPFAFMQECKKRYGDAFTLEFKGLGKHIFFSHPDAIQQVFKGDPEVFYAGEGNAILRPFLGECSLLLLDACPHMQHRKIMSPAFHGDRMRAYGKLMKKVVESALSFYELNQTFNVHSLMLDISLEIILQSVFGEECTRISDMKTLLVPLLDSASFSTLVSVPDKSDSGLWHAWEKFRTRSSQLDVLIFAEITERRGNATLKNEDILSLLLASHSDVGKFSDIELRDEIVTLLLAGHETTATALTWAFYWIHCTPGVQETLISELDFYGTDEKLDSLHQLSYLDAVVKETLRIYPVIPVVSRRVQVPVKILEFTIDAGMQITPCIYLTHHREDLYPDPGSFKPERFLERRFTPHEYLPFGGGVRRCIGMAFGLTEMKIVIATILKRYSLELLENKPVVPVRRTVTIAPAGGVKMRLIKDRLSKVSN